MAADAPAAARDKLSVAEVLHRFVDSLGLHANTAENLHQLVRENLDEKADVDAYEKEANPWASKSDEEVLNAAVDGDQVAAAEYRRRRAAQPAEA